MAEGLAGQCLAGVLDIGLVAMLRTDLLEGAPEGVLGMMQKAEVGGQVHVIHLPSGRAPPKP